MENQQSRESAIEYTPEKVREFFMIRALYELTYKQKVALELQQKENIFTSNARRTAELADNVAAYQAYWESIDAAERAKEDRACAEGKEELRLFEEFLRNEAAQRLMTLTSEARLAKTPPPSFNQICIDIQKNAGNKAPYVFWEPERWRRRLSELRSDEQAEEETFRSAIANVNTPEKPRAPDLIPVSDIDIAILPPLNPEAEAAAAQTTVPLETTDASPVTLPPRSPLTPVVSRKITVNAGMAPVQHMALLREREQAAKQQIAPLIEQSESLAEEAKAAMRHAAPENIFSTIVALQQHVRLLGVQLRESAWIPRETAIQLDDIREQLDTITDSLQEKLRRILRKEGSA